MLCEQCNTREATIVIREVVNGVVAQHHLCSQCASASELGALFDGDSPFAKLLSGILALGMNEENEKEKEESEESLICCPVCQTSFRDFVKNGRFGCAECYETFGPLVHDNIKKIQGSDSHVGKHPRYPGEMCGQVNQTDVDKKEKDLKEQLEILAARQKEAVSEEDYEAAARYRDEIKSLKERMKQDNEVV